MTLASCGQKEKVERAQRLATFRVFRGPLLFLPLPTPLPTPHSPLSLSTSPPLPPQAVVEYPAQGSKTVMNVHRFLADVTVVVHAAYIAFVILGLAAILLGAALAGSGFAISGSRGSPLAIGIVGSVAVRIVCPLTMLEDACVQQAGQEGYPGSFIAYWAHELIFFHALLSSSPVTACMQPCWQCY